MDLVGKLQANCLSLVEPQLNPSLFYYGNVSPLTLPVATLTPYMAAELLG